METTGSAAKKMKQHNQMLGYADIPKEILFYELLPRLPIKQILKFRLVSKRWYNLTNEFLFIINQAHHSTYSSSNKFVYMYKTGIDSLSILSFEEHSQYRLPPPYPPTTPKMMYQGTYAGLVYGYTFCHELIFVSNAITQRTVFVENPLNDIFPLDRLALAFDPPLTPNAGPELMRFKLICPIDNVANVTFKVYCSARTEWLDTNAYVELDSKPFLWGSQYTQSNVFVNEEVAGTIPLPTNHRGITMDSQLTVWLRRKEWQKVREVSLDTIIKENWDVLAPHTKKTKDCLTSFYRHHIVYTMSYEGGDMLMFWVASDEEGIFKNYGTKRVECARSERFLFTLPLQSYTSQEPKWGCKWALKFLSPCAA